MSLRAQVVDRADALANDLDLNHVKEWLAAKPGRKAAGYLPVYAPRELIAAVGMLPVGVHGGGDRLEIIKGDACYQSYICHLPRSVVELLLGGKLDCLDAVLFPSTCDVIRNLSGIWKLQKPDCYVRYLDLPQVLDPSIGVPFWTMEMRHVLNDLAKLAGCEDPEAGLRQAIVDYNAVRARIAELYAWRRERPWDIPTAELYQLMKALESLPAADWMQLSADYLAAIEAEPGRPRDNCRVVVTGAFCEQPPLGLLKTIERAGCYIVDDDLLLGNRMLKQPVSTEGDPVQALAETFVLHSMKSSVIYEDDPTGKQALMKQRVDAAKADGIVFAAPSFCDPALLDRPMLRSGAEAAGIPCIAFKYAENTGQFQPFREQAGTFSDSIKLWGAG